MLLNCKFGFIEVVIGDSFKLGPGRWRVENMDLSYCFRTKQAPNGTFAVMCSLIEGEVRTDLLPYMWNNEEGYVASLSGCTVAAFCYVDWAREFELTNSEARQSTGAL